MKKVSLFILFLSFTYSAFSQVQFQKGSLSEMFKLAKEQNKILMVDVLTDWCKWCIELDNKVYSRKDIGDYANANQVNYKIDAEKGEGMNLQRNIKSRGILQYYS